MTAIDQVRRLWRHAVWADAELLRALSGASRPSDEAVREYAHILGAEEVWLSRLESRPSRLAVWPSLALDACAELAGTIVGGYDALLATLDDAALERPCTYTNSAGLTFTNAVGDILLHVALHGQYHRGKVNLMLRQTDAPPAPTDFISFVRGVPAAREQGLGPGAKGLG
jgi:uncharacterized damage-inducible protein DinB